MAEHSLVDRAIDILDVLSECPDGRSVSEIAQGLSIPASATHRLLALLSNKGVVEQDLRSKTYRLTLVVPALGLRYLSSLTFLEMARPVLDELARETRELVRLAVVSRGELLWVAKAQGSRSSLRIDTLEGRSALLHVTAAGKAWLASMPDEEAVKLFSKQRVRVQAAALGPHAITAEDALVADLRACRERGFAITYDEAEAGVAAVGVVIRNGVSINSAAVGTVSVAGPTARIRRQDLEQMSVRVLEKARQLSSIWPASSVAEHHRGASKNRSRRG